MKCTRAVSAPVLFQACATPRGMKKPDQYDVVTAALNAGLDLSFQRDPIWGSPQADAMYIRYGGPSRAGNPFAQPQALNVAIAAAYWVAWRNLFAQDIRREETRCRVITRFERMLGDLFFTRSGNLGYRVALQRFQSANRRACPEPRRFSFSGLRISAQQTLSPLTLTRLIRR